VRIENTQIQEGNDRNDEARQVIGWQAVIDREGLLPGLLVVNGFEPARHMHLSLLSIGRKHSSRHTVYHTFRSEEKRLSDRLLVVSEL
jgi:hypothetical protein